MAHRYSAAEVAAARALEAAALRLPNTRDAARIKQAALDEARAILMGRPAERVQELDRQFMRSFT